MWLVAADIHRFGICRAAPDPISWLSCGYLDQERGLGWLGMEWWGWGEQSQQERVPQAGPKAHRPSGEEQRVP